MSARNDSRRAFLRRCMWTGLAAGAGTLAAPFGTARAAGGGPRLVVVFQRGGADGLNAVVPFGDGDYYALRGSLAISPPGHGAAGALALDGSFGLHPALAPMLPLYYAGELALLPCVGHDDATRSHFDAQDHLEVASANRRLEGWMNRYLQTHGTHRPLRAVSIGGHTARGLSGAAPVSTFSDLRDFTLGESPQAAELLDVLAPLLAEGPQRTRHRRAFRTAGRSVIEDFQVLQTLAGPYAPAFGADYPDSRLGRQLLQAAQLLKSGVGAEIVTVDTGGWDTHASQGTTDGAHAAALDGLARALAAFRTDMGYAMAEVLVLVMTEFGRTPDRNASGGTDHGHAAAWMALGAGVRGGVHLGPHGWPGLGPASLREGRYLQHTVDYRDVYAEILARHLLSPDPGAALLGYQGSPVGFLV